MRRPSDIEACRRTLTYQQVERLTDVVDSQLEVPGRGNYPTLKMSVRKLVEAVRRRLDADDMAVNDIRINGGAASYIIMGDDDQVYNDLDIIFCLDQSCHFSTAIQQTYDLDKVKDSALLALLEFLPEEASRERLSPGALAEAYLYKMVKIDGSRTGSACFDRWSLISLSNNVGRSVEIKFVVSMRRQYEFSIDSFQVIIDGFLRFFSVLPAPPVTDDSFYPTVIAESAYGDFEAAVQHTKKRLIATHNPEEVRGGGLLKYCCLLARRYRLSKDVDAGSLERYMCSRFFIDFPDAERQSVQLENYLANHFTGTWHLLRIPWLSTLRTVVSRGALCLGHRRKETLALIDQLVTLERRPVTLWTYGRPVPTEGSCCSSQSSPSCELSDVDEMSNCGDMSSVLSECATDADEDKLADVVDVTTPCCESPAPAFSTTGYGYNPCMPSVPLGYYVPYFPYPMYFNVPPPPLPGYVHQS